MTDFNIKKWLIIIALVAAALYAVLPKYHFERDGMMMFRCNVITGSITAESLSTALRDVLGQDFEPNPDTD